MFKIEVILHLLKYKTTGDKDLMWIDIIESNRAW